MNVPGEGGRERKARRARREVKKWWIGGISRFSQRARGKQECLLCTVGGVGDFGL